VLLGLIRHGHAAGKTESVSKIPEHDVGDLGVDGEGAIIVIINGREIRCIGAQS
jgi:hypothetical protein